MSTKTENPMTSELKSHSLNRVENSWILLAKETLLENSSFSIVSLPHPASGKPSKYCIDDEKNKIYEVVTFNEPYRSWFVGEHVKSDSSMLMVTPFNPLYLILPKVMKECSSRAIPLEDLLSDKGFSKLVNFIPNLEVIADLKGIPEMKAYKYNEEKTLNWLEARVRKLAKILRDKNVHVTSGAISTTFVTSNISNDVIDEEFYLKYAHGLISEYLQENLSVLLEKRFDFKPELIEAIGKKRKSEIVETEVNKKIKCESNSEEYKENGEPENSYKNSTEVKKMKPLTAKEKARQKAASGTKTISSFFTKK